MKSIPLAAGLCLALAAPLLPADDRPAKPQPDSFRVVGYLPEYRVGSFAADQAKHLTDLVYFAVEPGADGRLNADAIRPATLKLLKEIKRRHGVRLHLCLGGWGRSRGFAPLAASATARRRLADEATAFCRAHGFDGVDVDWEHPEGAAQARDHGLLMEAIQKSFAPHKLRLTMAVAAWQPLRPEAIRAADGVHLMAYDGDGRHSTVEFAQTSIARLREKGVPAGKLLLGVPFYGRSITARDRAVTYAELVKKHRPAADVDEVDGVYFNGPQTIQRKTRLALKAGLAGVMVWEVGQDAPGDAALVPKIRPAVDAARPKR